MVLLLALIACRTSMGPDQVRTYSDEEFEQVTEAYNALLQKGVTDDGYVDYDLITGERASLDDYLLLAAQRTHHKRAAVRLHFWINVYNALVIYQIIERGKPDSVMDVTGTLPVTGAGFFFETEFLVNDQWLTLYEIEHKQIRMKAMDHRIHAALVCGARSCPPLRNTIYMRARMDEQLDDRMAAWVQDPERGIKLGDDGSIQFSPIFDWFRQDFEVWSGGNNVCNIGASHLKGALRKEVQAQADRGCKPQYWEYDWRLNDAAAVANYFR